MNLPSHARCPSAALAAAALLATLVAPQLARPARAQDGLLGRNVELLHGPVLGSQRIIGLGGAFVAVAEGAEGHTVNPASIAVRAPWGANSWFDWDWTVDWLVTSDSSVRLGAGDRPGQGASRNAFLLGANIKLQEIGFAIHSVSQWADRRRARPGGGAEVVRYTQNLGVFGVAYAFLDGELVAGLTTFAGSASMSLHRVQGNGRLAREQQVTLPQSDALWVGGLLLKPHGKPWRIGVTVRPEGIQGAPARSSDAATELPPLPDHIVVPGEIRLGAAWMLGPRRFNTRPAYDRARLPRWGRRYSEMHRKYTLIVAEAVVTGPSQGALNATSWFLGEREPVGESTTVGVHAGVEREVLGNRLTLRSGTYWEPSRVAERPGRAHVTTGFDLRATLGWDWKIAAVADIAYAYRNLAVGVGFWH